MSVIDIRPVRREGARLVIGLAGQSGSGKTYTAIQLAYGLAKGRGEKVGFLDTENRRGSLYANAVEEPFLIGDLYAPFSPARYVDAIRAFQAAGVEVLVIDSVTHEWEGTGGCEEIARGSSNSAIGWAKAKAEHKRFMNILLQSDMHIIACIRAREKIDFSNPKDPIKLGVQPVCEKNFMFEMTASLMMEDAGRTQKVLKCPDELKGILGRGSGFLSREDGEALRAWVDGGHRLDPAVEAARNTLQSLTEQGIDALTKAVHATPSHIQRALGVEFFKTIKAAAQAHDDHRRGHAENPGASRFSRDEDPGPADGEPTL